VALRRGVPGQARQAISALFELRGMKQVIVVDDEIDVLSDAQIEWAMSARFRPDRDIVLAPDLPAYYADPTATAEQTVTKIGYDLTAPYETLQTIESRRPRPPQLNKPPRKQTVVEALQSGPMYFMQIMEAVGSRDGREIVLELDELRERGLLGRLPEGQWVLQPAAKP
jgi:3-polyprenyl-4-hydroxybenzoate decarboxylase